MAGRKILVTLALTMTSLAAIAVLTAALAASALWATVAEANAVEPGTPSPERILLKLTDLYRQAKSISVEMNRSQTIGSKTTTATTTVAFQRPNRLAVRSKGQLSVADLVSDGKTLVSFIPAANKYVEAKAPATVPLLLRDPATAEILEFMMIAELCAADPYDKLMEGVKTAEYAGLDTLAGVKTHHLKFTGFDFDWQMWVIAEGDPLLRRIVIDLAKPVAKSRLAAKLKKQKVEMIQDYTGWKLDREVDEKAFAFTPPAGAEKVESLADALDTGAGGESAPSPLVGKPAGDVSLKLLDKGEFRLKDHRDSKIVMLDFWATWCGPCVKELPILTEVAEAYKDKGVILCAVNLQETPDVVRSFLKEQKLQFTVALDAEGTVGRAYGVEAIPLLVLVDKQGVVRSVHLGYDPGIKAKLRKELDALLAGKELSKPGATH